MPPSDRLRTPTQTTTSALTVTLHTTPSTPKGGLTRPHTTRTHDADRTWVLLYVPSHNQEDPRVIRWVYALGHTKEKLTILKARKISTAKAHDTKRTCITQG